MKSTIKLTAAILLLFLLGKCTSMDSDHTAAQPLNVILLIGDGMGVPQISTAYYFGDEKANFSQFKHIGLHKTADLTHKVTDSAAGATAFSIGQKTFKRAIGVSADSMAQETILEHLQNKGYQTGLISLTSITHATPAAFYAHVNDRDMHETIAEQLLDAEIDFIAGGGRQYFGKRSDHQDLFKRFLEKGYHLDTSALSKPDFEKRNAYILVDNSFPSITMGRDAFLQKATGYALDYFSRQTSPFFLMVEGSYIDWAGHAEDEDMLITEVEDFDRTLGVVLEFMETNPNTLLVVTADHETGEVSLGKKYEVDEQTKVVREKPEEVQIYFNSDQHSAELIPVFAKGPGAEFFQGIYENNEIYHKIMASLEGATK